MQLDHAHITIRERSFNDILDLSLHIVRAHAWGLIGAFASGVIPLMLVNELLLAKYRELDFELGFPVVHMLLMTLLVLYQIPLGTAFATLYLGQVLFSERTEPRKIVRNLLASLPQLIFHQVFLRLIFLTWSFLNEVILLERNPIRRSVSYKSTYMRSKNLHPREFSDRILRMIGMFLLAGVLSMTLWLSIFLARSLLLGSFEWDRTMTTFYYPLAMWITACYFSVVRFLAYLDKRIRQEGWEVELLMRAEANRLKQQLT